MLSAYLSLPQLDKACCPFCGRFPVGAVVWFNGADARFGVSCLCNASHRLPLVSLDQLDADDVAGGDSASVWDGRCFDLELFQTRARSWTSIVTDEFARVFGEIIDDDITGRWSDGGD